MDVRRNAVLTVGADVTRKEAEALGKAFYQSEFVEVIQMKNDVDTFANLSISDLASMIILGHGSHKSYGGLDPDDFAGMFERNFKMSFSEGSKLAVEHLYLVGCNIGFIQHNGYSIAQTIIEQLHKRGFTNTILHCAGYLAKKNQRDHDLMVTVIENPGLKGLQENIAQLERADGVIVSDVGYIRVALQLKDVQKELLVQGANPRDELNKAENTFIANENLDSRSERISKALRERNELNLANVIKILKIQRRYLQLKNDVPSSLKATALHGYIKDLNQCNDGNWKQKFFKITDRANKNPIFNKESNTLKLINYINENNDEGVRLIQLAHDPIFQDFELIEITEESTLEELKGEARDVSSVLEREINTLQSSILAKAFFVQSQILLKQAKIAAVQAVEAAPDVAAAVAAAEQHIGNEQVTKGAASRTSAFLHGVIDRNKVPGVGLENN